MRLSFGVIADLASIDPFPNGRVEKALSPFLPSILAKILMRRRALRSLKTDRRCDKLFHVHGDSLSTLKRI
jgi:hypothetical protein